VNAVIAKAANLLVLGGIVGHFAIHLMLVGDDYNAPNDTADSKSVALCGVSNALRSSNQVRRIARATNSITVKYSLDWDSSAEMRRTHC